jgi:hypothetical protein
MFVIDSQPGVMAHDHLRFASTSIPRFAVSEQRLDMSAALRYRNPITGS